MDSLEDFLVDAIGSLDKDDPVDTIGYPVNVF